MSLENHIATLSAKVEELSASNATLTAAVVGLIEALKAGTPAGAVPATEPSKRSRRTKAQIEADEAAAKAAAAAENGPANDARAEAQDAPEAPAPLHTTEPAVGAAPATDVFANAPAEIPTKEATIAAFQQLVAKFGKEAATDKARKILGELGVPNISSLPEDKRAQAIAAVNAELGA